MNAETILRSDLLDIIFENRNKQYGAYPLRKDYNKRLYQSLGLIVGLVLILFTWHYLLKHPTNEGSVIHCEIFVPDTELKKLEMPPNDPPALQKKVPPV